MIPRMTPRSSRQMLIADRSSRAKYRRLRPDNRDPATVNDLPLSGGGCWCGEPMSHDWEGKDDGAPHPR